MDDSSSTSTSSPALQPRETTAKAHPALLPYATDLPLLGVSYEIRGPLARIAVPPSKNFLHAIGQLVVPIFLIGYAVAYGPAILHEASETGGVTFMSVLSGLVGTTFWGAIVYVGFRSWFRARKRFTVIELTAERLVIDDYDAAGKPRCRSWRRHDVGRFHAGPVPWTTSELRGLGLHIHITGKTIVETMAGSDPKVAKWVADQLNEALSTPTVNVSQREKECSP